MQTTYNQKVVSAPLTPTYPSTMLRINQAGIVNGE